MNIYQRIVLIVGAIIFVTVLLTSPRVGYTDMYGIVPLRACEDYNVAPIVDIKTASVRGFAVLGATVLLCFALRSKQ